METNFQVILSVYSTLEKDEMDILKWQTQGGKNDSFMDMNEFLVSPCSCFRLFLLLQILTVQTLTMMATMKKRTPPMSPAVMARLLTFSGMAYLATTTIS